MFFLEQHPPVRLRGFFLLLSRDCKSEVALEQQNSSVQRQLSPQLHVGDPQTGQPLLIFNVFFFLDILREPMIPKVSLFQLFANNDSVCGALSKGYEIVLLAVYLLTVRTVAE